jgi:hypothetical protein
MPLSFSAFQTHRRWLISVLSSACYGDIYCAALQVPSLYVNICYLDFLLKIELGPSHVLLLFSWPPKLRNEQSILPYFSASKTASDLAYVCSVSGSSYGYILRAPGFPMDSHL